jgi:enoyl-CoA hydratase/carnithine racemase
MSVVEMDVAESIATITLDRPEKHNSLDDAMVAELHAALDELTDTPRVLVVRSSTPGIFVAGADIGRLRARTGDDALRRINGALFDRIASYRWPTVAVVDGPALGGGCELALACDFRVASERATFAQPELQLGILAAAGANSRLQRIAGLAVARRMLIAGVSLGAEEALSAGLVDVVVTSEALADALGSLVAGILRNSWQALELTKRALALADIDTASFDAAAQAVLFDSQEKRDRMDAFLNRTKRMNP